MEDRADAFLALPGGFGTLEEILEILTLKQLQAHSKPVVLLNVQGFFNSIVAQFECMYDRHFAKKEYRDMYFLAHSCASVFSYLTAYKPSSGVRKWTG